jgi:hypothetical protein
LFCFIGKLFVVFANVCVSLETFGNLRQGALKISAYEFYADDSVNAVNLK